MLRQNTTHEHTITDENDKKGKVIG